MKKIVFIALILMVLVSCGKGKKNNSSIKTSTEATKKKNVTKAVVVDSNGIANVSISSNDRMKFSIKKFTVKAGQKVKLMLIHTGKMDKKVMGHNVVILKQGIKRATFASLAAASKENDFIPVDTEDTVAYTKMIGGGEEASVEFTAPATGTYEFICSFPGHFGIMKGKMIVE